MLTEAALPAGASFGLAKIVFKDADGNDLVPESASIGVINFDFPGIESQPFVNDASAIDTWVFSEAQGVAPAGTVEVIFQLLNVDFAGGENPIWFDDAQASNVGARSATSASGAPVRHDPTRRSSASWRGIRSAGAGVCASPTQAAAPAAGSSGRWRERNTKPSGFDHAA